MISAQESYLPLPPRLLAALEAFCKITGLCVTQYTPDCQIALELCKEAKICAELPFYNRQGSPCRKNIKLAVNIVSNLGEPYYYSCPAGFIKIAVPFVRNGVYSGCFIAGPVIMEKNETAILTQILSLNFPLSRAAGPSGNTAASGGCAAFGAPGAAADWGQITPIIAAMKRAPSFSAKEVAALAVLLNQCVLPLPENGQIQVPSQPDPSCRHDAAPSRQRLAAAEKALLRHIAAGNAEKSRESMTAYLDSLLVLENGQLEPCKNHLVELCVLASRRGPSENGMLESFEFIHALNHVSDMQQLKKWTIHFTSHFTAKNLSQIYSGSSEVVTQVINLILSDEYFSMSLSDVADTLHVNSSWLSSHFKKETGQSFTSFVTQKKIQQARELLTGTDLRLVEISARCGFEEQSYFTKLFRKETGMTPKQYRDSAR